jgi:hypothetical protein
MAEWRIRCLAGEIGYTLSNVPSSPTDTHGGLISLVPYPAAHSILKKVHVGLDPLTLVILD